VRGSVVSCGVDIGGTFTDCVLTDGEGNVHTGKSPTTRQGLAEGFFSAIEIAARKAGYPLTDALAELPYLAHGTTVATNIVVQRTGARVALLTTRGHGDAVFIQRAAGRVAGLSMDELLDLELGTKPEPLVPRDLVFEIDERVDSRGNLLVPLNEAATLAALERATSAGVDAIAISFLWGFRNPRNEQRAKELVADHGALFTSVSHEVAPNWGEYERTMTTIINSYVGPDTASYIDDLRRELDERGFRGRFSVMKSNGGVSSARAASRYPVTLLFSGPAGALAGSQGLLDTLGVTDGNGITTDMGGTSFDIGLIVDGKPQRSEESLAARFAFHLPTIEIISIGSGGGSIAWIDPVTGGLKVGPRSAGAEPGPAAYARGGSDPTVTDADIVLGYINPDYFLGGELELRADLAEEAVGRLGKQLGLSMLETAAGIRTIVDAAMADAVRANTVARGYDPRIFDVLAFGGAGPLHAADYARELGSLGVIVPKADLSALWSAMGVAQADLVDVQERHAMLSEPFAAETVGAIAEELKSRGAELLKQHEMPLDGIELTVTAKMKYRLQVNTVDVPVETGDRQECEELIDRFEQRYRELFGAGSGHRAAGVEITGFLCTAVGSHRGATATLAPSAAPGRPAAAEPHGSRSVYWTHEGAHLETAIFRQQQIRPGWSTAGPAILELPDTTITVPPDYTVAVDGHGSVRLTRQANRRD
jgi:N-methylhydantoinase A